jgi:hypothetical protein
VSFYWEREGVMCFGVETRTRIKVKRYESGVLPYLQLVYWDEYFFLK